MCNRVFKLVVSTTSMFLFLLFSGMALAEVPPTDEIVIGGQMWNNWTKTSAGGSGAPTGETSGDYYRCKACHGWEGKGTEGGYVRRSRKDSRPNAGAGDGNATSRVIPWGTVTAAMITRTGTGRPITRGSASWVALDAEASSANTAAHHSGYTEGNLHPDYSAAAATQAAGGGNMPNAAMTAAQVANVVAYLNSGLAGPTPFFDFIFPAYNPVLYVMKANADADAGETYYNTFCMGCHGDPATDHNGANGGAPGGGILAYLAKDGKFSEFAHKAMWGSPDSIMTRAAMGSPTTQNITDVMRYLQILGKTGFPMDACLDGTWWGGVAKSGEGFNVEVSLNGEGKKIFNIFFYTSDPAGGNVYLMATGLVDGNAADVVVSIAAGGTWDDPTGVATADWGAGRFVVNDRGTVIGMTVTPNATQVAAGYTAVTYDLIRTTTPVNACS